MDNQHRKIKGYRELSQEDIDLMNEVKAEGLRLAVLIDKVKSVCGQDEAESARWLAMGRTSLQQGLMFLTRAVAKPEFF